MRSEQNCCDSIRNNISLVTNSIASPVSLHASRLESCVTVYACSAKVFMTFFCENTHFAVLEPPAALEVYPLIQASENFLLQHLLFVFPYAEESPFLSKFQHIASLQCTSLYPPCPHFRLVERLPSTGSTANPPATARYPLQPVMANPHTSVSPA